MVTRRFVSRHIVMLLGGYIDVESTKGAGSTFSFAIPVEPCSPTEGYDRTQMWRALVPPSALAVYTFGLRP